MARDGGKDGGLASRGTYHHGFRTKAAMFRKYTLGVLVLAVPGALAQEQFGIAHSNYAGTDAVPLNPSRMATQWSWMDLNVIGAEAFIWNDHVYMSGNDRSLLGEMGAGIRGAESGALYSYESLNGGTRHGFVNARLTGPAVALSLGRNSIGAHVSGRTALSITGVGNSLARFGYHGLGYAPQHGIRYRDDRLRIAGAAWTEIGASYARLLIARDNTLLSAGLTGKYVLAHAGAGLVMNALDYTVVDTTSLIVHDASGEYGFAAPAMNAGQGFGVDVGATYERTLENADGYVPHGSCDPMPYRYRIGLALIDMGGMRFKNGTTGTFRGSTAFFPDYNDINLDNGADVDSLLSAALTTYESGSSFKMGLPTAIAIQYDQWIMDHLYVGADMVQNLTIGDQLRMRRPNSIAVVPRYELKRFEAAVPLVIHEYDLRRPSLGLMLRLNTVVLGSDNLLSLITRGGVFGTDVYFRIKWTVFRSPACKGGKQREHRSGGREAMPCKFPE